METHSYLMHNLKGAYTIWYRDVLRFLRDRSRIFGSLAQPLLLLVVLGLGIGGLAKTFGGASPANALGVAFIDFLFPGILGMTVLFTALFSAVSIVWDREFGFLREVLVAPVSRVAVALGKVAGGATVAMFQAAIIMLIGPILGVHYDLLKVVLMLLIALLTAAVIASLGILFAARQKTMEGFQVIMNFLLFPMLLLSGAFFPIVAGPGAGAVLRAVEQIDPLAYGVDAMRQILLPGKLPAAFTLHHPAVDVLFLLGFFIVFLIPAVALFSKQD